MSGTFGGNSAERTAGKIGSSGQGEKDGGTARDDRTTSEERRSAELHRGRLEARERGDADAQSCGQRKLFGQERLAFTGGRAHAETVENRLRAGRSI